MDYGKFRYPPPPKPGGGGTGGGKTVKGELRAISYLWKTTVVGNRFGTDGPQPNVPTTWLSDHLRRCRQWHGVNLSVTFRPDGSVDPQGILLDELSYSGKTETCGIVGKTTVTDRHVTEPKIDSDGHGPYVEVKTLLGTRLGAFIPDIEVDALGHTWHQLADEAVAEAVEATSENQYLGTNNWAPKIFTYAKLKVYVDRTVGDWVSAARGNGFLTQQEIIEKQVGTSWLPEHHLYVDSKLTKSLTPTSVNHRDELEKWVDSDRPFDVFAFNALTAALEAWDRDTAPLKKREVAADFKKRYPDYYIGYIGP